MARHLSVAALRVLHAAASGSAHGFDIIDVTGLPGGTVYPALTRLERDGLLTSDWEDVRVARADKRPPRRYYHVTASGVRTLNDALATLHGLQPIRRPKLARANHR